MKFFDNIKDSVKKIVTLSDEEDDFDDDETYGDEDYDYDEEEPAYEEEEKKFEPSFEKKTYSPSSAGFTPPEYHTQDNRSFYSTKSAPKNTANLYRMDTQPSKKLKVTLFVLEDMDDARNVADCMIEKGVVTLADMTKLPTESVRRVLDFLDGVKYVCKSKIEVIAEKIYLIVPEAAELAGDFFGQVDTPSFF